MPPRRIDLQIEHVPVFDPGVFGLVGISRVDAKDVAEQLSSFLPSVSAELPTLTGGDDADDSAPRISRSRISACAARSTQAAESLKGVDRQETPAFWTVDNDDFVAASCHSQ